MSFYGCAVWSLDSCAVKHLDVCINVCEVSGKCHTSLLHSLSCCSSVFSTCYERFCNLFHSACNSDNLLVLIMSVIIVFLVLFA